MLKIKIENTENGELIEEEFDCMFAVIGKAIQDDDHPFGAANGRVIKVIPDDERLFTICVAQLQQLLIDIGEIIKFEGDENDE